MLVVDLHLFSSHSFKHSKVLNNNGETERKIILLLNRDSDTRLWSYHGKLRYCYVFEASLDYPVNIMPDVALYICLKKNKNNKMPVFFDFITKQEI